MAAHRGGLGGLLAGPRGSSQQKWHFSLTYWEVIPLAPLCLLLLQVHTLTHVPRYLIYIYTTLYTIYTMTYYICTIVLGLKVSPRISQR